MGIVSFGIGVMSNFYCMPRLIFTKTNWGSCRMHTGAPMREYYEIHTIAWVQRSLGRDRGYMFGEEFRHYVEDDLMKRTPYPDAKPMGAFPIGRRSE